LGIHHVRSGAHQTAWDIGFLVLGGMLIVAGWALQRRQATRAALDDARR
jgi:uncharacterized membrane protein